MISAHVINGTFDGRVLSALPDSIGHRLYRHNTAGVMLLDTFRPDRVPPHPFQYPLPSADLPLNLPTELIVFESLYDYLRKRGSANSFKKSYIGFARLLNELTGQPVLSIATDDDELDFACTAVNGRIERLEAHCDDLLVTSVNGRPEIQPLVPETDDDAEFLTNIPELRTAVPSAMVLERTVTWPTLLNGVAIQEWLAFSEHAEPILGMGSFDPPSDENEWELIQSS